MTPRKQPSENERLFLFVLFFPPLWPLGIVMLIGAGMEAARDGIASIYHRWCNRHDQPGHKPR